MQVFLKHVRLRLRKARLQLRKAIFLLQDFLSETTFEAVKLKLITENLQTFAVLLPEVLSHHLCPPIHSLFNVFMCQSILKYIREHLLVF